MVWPTPQTCAPQIPTVVPVLVVVGDLEIDDGSATARHQGLDRLTLCFAQAGGPGQQQAAIAVRVGLLKAGFAGDVKGHAHRHQGLP